MGLKKRQPKALNDLIMKQIIENIEHAVGLTTKIEWPVVCFQNRRIPCIIIC